MCGSGDRGGGGVSWVGLGGGALWKPCASLFVRNCHIISVPPSLPPNDMLFKLLVLLSMPQVSLQGTSVSLLKIDMANKPIVNDVSSVI